MYFSAFVDVQYCSKVARSLGLHRQTRIEKARMGKHFVPEKIEKGKKSFIVCDCSSSLENETILTCANIIKNVVTEIVCRLARIFNLLTSNLWKTLEYVVLRKITNSIERSRQRI